LFERLIGGKHHSAFFYGKIHISMNYIASKILMIRPVKFGYNPQTAGSNAFQTEVDLSDEEVQSNALREFDSMIEKLKDLGIEVLIFNDTDEPHTPDSIFPNNWFSTHPDGTLCLYPMEAPARRLERNPKIISRIKNNISLTRILDFSEYEAQNKFLEGTGSLILDHENKIAYASISSRTNEEVLAVWAKKSGFTIVKFHSFDEDGKAVYHTNVLMCLGDKFAVICLESISDKSEKQMIARNLRRTDKEIIEISFEQMRSFAGNMILLQNKNGEKFIVMSETARKSLREDQIANLEKYAKPVSFDIEMIEKCGGGSVRCMIAEIF
jgi:hypothetical protein